MAVGPAGTLNDTNVPPQNYGGVSPKRGEDFKEAVKRSTTSNEASAKRSSKGNDSSQHSQDTSKSLPIILATRPPINLGNPIGQQGAPLYDSQGVGSNAGPETKAPSPPATGVPPDQLLWSTAVWPKVDAQGQVLMLAANPDHAHDVWKSLSPQTKMGVAIYMAKYYGTDFARKFVATHDAAKLPRTEFRQVGPEVTPAQLKARGFHHAGRQMSMGVEAWFDASGNRIHRVMPRQTTEETKPQDKTPEKTPPTQVAPPPVKEPTDPVCKESKQLSDSICDNSARICRIAGQLGPSDAAAQASCEKAKTTCADATKATTECR